MPLGRHSNLCSYYVVCLLCFNGNYWCYFLRERGWSFIKKAGTIILLSTIVIWFLSFFGWGKLFTGNVNIFGTILAFAVIVCFVWLLFRKPRQAVK